MAEYTNFSNSKLPGFSDEYFVTGSRSTPGVLVTELSDRWGGRRWRKLVRRVWRLLLKVLKTLTGAKVERKVVVSRESPWWAVCGGRS